MFISSSPTLMLMGLQPYENACHQETKRMCDQIVNTMLPSGSGVEIDNAVYLKHLVLLVSIMQ